jgi:hypothetical protein
MYRTSDLACERRIKPALLGLEGNCGCSTIDYGNGNVEKLSQVSLKNILPKTMKPRTEVRQIAIMSLPLCLPLPSPSQRGPCLPSEVNRMTRHLTRKDFGECQKKGKPNSLRYRQSGCRSVIFISSALVYL